MWPVATSLYDDSTKLYGGSVFVTQSLPLSPTDYSSSVPIQTSTVYFSTASTISSPLILPEAIQKIEVPYATTNVNSLVSPYNLLQIPVENTVTVMTDDPYFLSKDLESITAPMPRPKAVDNEFIEIIKTVYNLDDDEESYLEKKVNEWIEKYGKYAIESLYYFGRRGFIKANTLSSILEVVGMVNSYWSYNGRLALLSYFLNDRSPKIRYGAIVGISYMDSSEVLNSLKVRLNEEDIPIIRTTLRAVIAQLENN